MSRTRCAFSLTELLVVAAIMAILGSLLFAVSAPAREKARETHCKANLRQLCAAINLYSSDSDAGEELPGVTATSFEFLNNFSVLDEYINSKDILYCPNTPERAKRKLSSSYWWRVPSLNLPEDAPAAQRTANEALLQEMRSVGPTFPFIVCQVHDITYYMPREDYLYPAFSQMYAIEVGLDGHVSAGRRPYLRSDWLTPVLTSN